MATTRVRVTRKAELPERIRPRKNPRQGRSRALVEAILEAGARVFAERGWGATTTARIAEIAGVSIGSLYQYFPDKTALATAIIERRSKEEMAFHLARLSQLPPASSLADTFAELVRATLAFQRQSPGLHRALLDAMPHVGRHELLAERVRRTAAALRAILERHHVDHPDLDLATHVLVNAIHSLTHDGILPRPSDLDDERLTVEILRLVFGYLGAASPPLDERRA